jgi:hypothetical protein
MNKNNAKVITGIVRLSYANVWEPRSINGSNPKYSVSIIIPKSDQETLARINQAVDAAITEGVGKFGGKIPPKGSLKLPLRDGDVERDDEAYKNSYYINANSITAPEVVDAHVQPILERSEIYSGVYARVSISFYAFNSNGNRGIAAGLGNIQKIKDGEHLGGHASATEDFESDSSHSSDSHSSDSHSAGNNTASSRSVNDRSVNDRSVDDDSDSFLD